MAISAFAARSDSAKIRSIAFSFALMFAVFSHPTVATADSSGKTQSTPSLFDLPSKWVDQDNRPFEWRSLSGHTTLIALVYTTCQMACPLITRELSTLTGRLSEAKLSKVRVVLASFDPTRDTPTQLKEYSKKHKLDQPRWTLLSSSDESARELAVVLGTQYKKLQNGEFSHSNTITVLAPDGRIAHQQADLGVGREETLKAIEAVLH